MSPKYLKYYVEAPRKIINILEAVVKVGNWATL